MDKDMPLREYKKLGKGALNARIRDLFDQALRCKDLAKASSLVRRAKKIALSTRVRIPKDLKKRICRSCGAYLISGNNATIRTQRGKVVIRCFECKHISRIPYVLEKKAFRLSKQAKRAEI